MGPPRRLPRQLRSRRSLSHAWAWLTLLLFFLGVLRSAVDSAWCGTKIISARWQRQALVLGRTARAASLPSRTWEQSYKDASALEKRLQATLEKAKTTVQMLDTQFTTAANVPKVPPIPTRAPLSDSDKFSNRARKSDNRFDKKGKPKLDRMEDFVEKENLLFDKGEVFGRLDETPILSYMASPQGKAIGMSSGSNLLEMPERVYPAQLMMGAGDDPAATSEQNARWRESLTDLTDSLEGLWPMVEAAVAGVKSAKERADARCPPSLLEFQKRALEAAAFSHQDQGIDMQELNLEQELQILKTTSDLHPLLASFEASVLEVEGCRNEINVRQKEADSFGYDTWQYQKRMTRVQILKDRLKRVTYEVQTIFQTARDQEIGGSLESITGMVAEEAQAAVKEIGNTLQRLNPFR